MEFSRWISAQDKVTVASMMINNTRSLEVIKALYNLTDKDLALINQEIHTNNSNVLILKQKGNRK